MWKERPYLPIIILLALIGLACNAFAGDVEPDFDPPPTIDPVVGEGDDYADTEPGLAATPTLPGDTADEENGEGQPRVTTLVDLNVRSGPGVAYEIIDFLLEGSRADIIGQNEEGNWWRIACPDEEETAECWVSGGSQFTVASNVEGVAVVESPPLPTPAPPSPEPGVALLVYVDNGRLYLSRLNLSHDPHTASSPIQLVNDTEVVAISIAPDGRRVAYLNGRGPYSLKTVNIDGRDERTLVEAADLELPDGYDETEWELRLRQIQWLANSQEVAFNTTLVNLIGPGTGPQEDFWTVDLEGEMDQIFAPGLGGGYFAISPGGTILLSRDTEIVRAGLDGRVQSLLSFDFINTASEFIYYPTPHWSSDGSVAYVGIPSAEPFGPNPQTHLWRIPAAGGATRLGSIPENLLFNDLYWNDSGSHLAYTLPIDEPDFPTPRLMVASGSGQLGPDGLPYTTDGPLRLHGWSNNNQNFLFSGIGYFAIGQPLTDEVRVPLPSDSRVEDGQWVTGSTYVVSLQPGGSGNWLLVSGNLVGNTTSLVDLSSERPFFSLWTP